jgi:hypothetical protein
LSPQLSRAGEWFLRSGIQDASGGVARYYLAKEQRNAPISTEITGYAASFFAWMHSASGDERYLDAACDSARFLAAIALGFDGVMPYEVAPMEFTYFFDSGIIVRGLLAVWRITREQALLDAALAIGASMARDFESASGDFHPILAIPQLTPIPRDPVRWSRSPGCYQLKSAMAWHDLSEAAGDAALAAPYYRVLEASLANWNDFLPGHAERPRIMDRLHAFCYFLEGLLPSAAGAGHAAQRAADSGDAAERAAAAFTAGIARAAGLLREIAPEFARADVFAQLLRARLGAACCGAVALDREAAAWEAGQLAEYQASSADPRIAGGYWFGRAGAEWLLFINPVSTAFAAQALELWSGAPFDRRQLI